MSDAKALSKAEALDSAEDRIVAALPEVLDRLIAQAKAGDSRVAVYLCDRVMGKAGAAADRREAPSAFSPRIVIPGADALETLREKLDRLGAARGV